MTGRARGAGRVRIVGIGDSTTAGTPAWRSPLESPPDGAGDETSQYTYWLMRMHPDWEVLNRGVNGERSDQIRARFLRDVLSVKPAATVVIAGVNDVYQGRPPSQVTTQLQAMYDDALASSILVVAGSIIPYNTATPEQNARMHEINAWIRSRADLRPNLFFADTRAAAGHPSNIDRLVDTADDLHPTAAGYRLMAEAIAPVLERALGVRT